MKSLATALLVLVMGQTGFAAQKEELKCADIAVRTATKANFKRYGASTSSCGTKLLTAGDYLETYLVCITDETEPSEWVVVMSKKGNICKVKFADNQYDSETPNFESSEGLLKTVECSIDYGDNKLVCK